MRLIDIGINLMHSSFKRDREEVIRTSCDAGVSPLIITGTGEKSSREAAEYAAEYNARCAEEPRKLYVTAGVHPHEAKNCDERTIDALRSLASEYGAVAIGECGLDYNRDFSPRDLQRKWFTKQIELAAEIKRPLFLHERDAFEDFAAILENYKAAVPAMAVHCFTGNEKELEKYLELGCYIGITGWICDERRGAHLGALVKKIPADKIMIETDAPFLLPRNLPGKVRDRRNEPGYLPHIAKTIAGHLEKDLSLFAEETFTNTKKFFGI
jgi:TatD DNase family protein